MAEASRLRGVTLGALALALALGAVACGDDAPPEDGGTPDAGPAADTFPTRDAGPAADTPPPSQDAAPADDAPGCTPDCLGKLCGDDGCGGSCGDCQPEQTCSAAGTCETDTGDCGDGVCDDPEDCVSCSQDCGPCGPVCGDGLCAPIEDCESCPSDCGACGECGDGVCQASETCQSCATDCGPCAAVCGDGICAPEEACETCEADCGPCATVCGDGLCEAPESCVSCESDCGPCSADGELYCFEMTQCLNDCTQAPGGDANACFASCQAQGLPGEGPLFAVFYACLVGCADPTTGAFGFACMQEECLGVSADCYAGATYGPGADCGELVGCLDACNATEGGAPPECTRACYNGATKPTAELRFAGEYCIFGECLTGTTLDFGCLFTVAAPGGACYDLASQCSAPTPE